MFACFALEKADLAGKMFRSFARCRSLQLGVDAPLSTLASIETGFFKLSQAVKTNEDVPRKIVRVVRIIDKQIRSFVICDTPYTTDIYHFLWLTVWLFLPILCGACAHVFSGLVYPILSG